MRSLHRAQCGWAAVALIWLLWLPPLMVQMERLQKKADRAEAEAAAARQKKAELEKQAQELAGESWPQEMIGVPGPVRPVLPD
jgi:hypothetical protein